jgi:GNAT superfamily N-acetyltransferase
VSGDAPFELVAGAFSVSTDRRRLDVDRIHAYLSQRSYWAKGIPRAVVERSIENSIAFGLHGEAGMIGFGRVISDRATFAYLSDIYVEEEFRGRGLSKLIVRAMKEHPAFAGIRRWSLVTRDAHALYRQFGFVEAAKPKSYMEILVDNAYGGESC